MTVTNAAADTRAAVAARREQLDEVLRRYGASNPRLFGSVARGDATTDSDIDVLVDLDPAGGNPLMRLAGMSEEFRRVLGVDVDVVAAELLRDGVAYRDHLNSEDPTLADMAFDAILRNLAVIGEEVKALPEESIASMPEVPWASIAGPRNVVVHEYFRIDQD